MPFAPKFETVFESVVLDNILLIVKDDMKAALDYYYPTAPLLPDFAQRTLGNFIQLTLPALAIEPDRITGDDGEQYTSPQMRILLYLAVEDADAANVTRKLMKYVRALVAVLKTATDARYLVNVTPNRVFGLTKEITWQYGDLTEAPQRSVWMNHCQFEFTLKYNER